jgi:16S rRNA A1518/A1519 N6-dimethyltransferase RsmA/KsgA/DIM1 with predicted DNA glycosylase/AP lyase activity
LRAENLSVEDFVRISNYLSWAVRWWRLL